MSLSLLVTANNFRH